MGILFRKNNHRFLQQLACFARDAFAGSAHFVLRFM
jgi:hypothetical protein